MWFLPTSVTTSRHFANGCCASEPCLNGATCIESCKDLDRKLNCTCAEGFTGELCGTKAVFCTDYINNKSGIYTLFDKKGSTFQVYCDLDSEEDFVWTLIESFSLHLRDRANHKGFANDWPVNQRRLHWRNFRLSRIYMEQIQNSNATHVRATCNFHANGLSFTDYARAKLSNFDILTLNVQACVMFEFVSVRSNHCSDCWVKVVQEINRHVSLDSTEICSESPALFKLALDGKHVLFEENFGYYNIKNALHSCSALPRSTTQWWIGTRK